MEASEAKLPTVPTRSKEKADARVTLVNVK